MKHQVSVETLNNGSRVLWVDVPEAKYVIVEFNFEAGYRYVARDRYDLPHVLEHLFVTPAGWNEAEFLSEVIMNGADYGAWTNDKTVKYDFKAPLFDWERVADLVIAAINQPKFEPEHFKKELAIVETELEDCLNNHSRLMWPIYAQATGIEAETYANRLKYLKNITLEEIKKHYREYFTTENLDITVCGDLRKIRTKMRQKFENLKLGRGQKVQRIFLRNNGGSHLVRKKGVQNIDFTYGMILDRKMTPRETTAMRFVLFALFSSAKSRIYSQARELGIVYSIYGGRYNNENSAEFYINGEVAHKNAQKLFKLVANELQKVVDEGFADAEIERAKQAILGDLSMEDTTPRDIYSFYYDRYFMFDEMDDYNEYLDLVKSIEAFDVNKIAREFIQSDKKALVVLSDCKAGVIKKLGQILQISEE